ncbi:MAG TPA: hypothetical protein VFC61_10445 [Blastocatellia bacterium]|nr:hypothetical protein [Blastocatellia bacterium]
MECKGVLACTLLAVASLAPAVIARHGGRQQAQNPTQAGARAGGDQVEVKTDRFSGVTTVTLKPQMVLDTPEHFITMSLEAKFGDGKIRDEADRAAEVLGEGAVVRFESQARVPTDFGDKELHFIVDGKRLKIGESAGGVSGLPSRDPRLRPGFTVLEAFVNALTAAQLRQIAGAGRVEMRLGRYEFTLSPGVLGNLREFAGEFKRHAPSGKLKGDRP